MPSFNRISRMVFIAVLLCSYTALFSVEGYLRYCYPHTDISYQEATYTLTADAGSHAEKLVKTGHTDEPVYKNRSKSKKTNWLNKRFSPVSPATVPASAEAIAIDYAVIRKIYFSFDQHIITTETDHASLRAPPAC